jgi:hypothetical protein
MAEITLGISNCIEMYMGMEPITGEAPNNMIYDNAMHKATTSGINYDEYNDFKIIDAKKGISKEEIKDYTVEEIINILSKYPKNYRFLCMGYEEGFSAIVDHDNGMISIDLNDFADQLVNTFKEKD